VSRYVFKLPDLGEGAVEAEIVGWRVKPGDVVAEDDALVEVMTEKASMEVPAPVSGRVLSTQGGPGDRIAVGGELAVFDTSVVPAASATAAASPAPPAKAREAAPPPAQSAAAKPDAPGAAASPADSDATASSRVLTSPAIRRRAQEAGIDLSRVTGTGPNGRITRDDLDQHLQRAGQAGSPPATGAAPAASADAATQEIRIIGLRRVIAERVSASARNIPHFSYVEEIDVTELERLRTHLNAQRGEDGESLSYLPFLIIALVRTLKDFPQCNGWYDAERGVVVRHRAVHVGVATQTSDGLKVPVVRDAQQKTLGQIASEIRRLAQAARNNKATLAELSGSTITVTSLGKLGGIASTPIINAPELAIIGVNRAAERPVVFDGAITIRRMMNLSSSFDHRFIDGHDAAAMIQALRERLEHPATMFAA